MIVDSSALIATLEIAIEPVTVQQGEIARRAHQRYGRGSGSHARLDFGDCFAYALSVTTGESLLFVGDDFTTPMSSRPSPDTGPARPSLISSTPRTMEP